MLSPPGETQDVKDQILIELDRALRARLVRDSLLVLLGHTALLVLITVVMWGDTPGFQLEWWIVSVFVVTLARTIWQRRAGRPELTDGALLNGTRALVLLQGLAWGIGAAILQQSISIEYTAIVLMGLAGLVTAGTNTLAADRPSIYILLGSMYVPVVIGLLSAGTGRVTLVVAIMNVIFVFAMLLLHQRGYVALVEQLRTSIALKGSEARFRRVVESNIIGVCFWEPAGLISEANDELLRLLGYTREDLVAGLLNWRSLSPPEFAAAAIQAVRATMAGESTPPRAKELLRKDGSRVPVLVGLAPLNEPGNRGVAFILDMTTSTRAEQQARWRAALLTAQVRASADGILIVDTQGRKVLQNQRLEGLFAIPQEIVDDDDDSKQRIFVATQVKYPEPFLARIEHLNSHPDEISRDEVELANGTVLDRYSSPVTGEAGENYGRIWTFHDVTEHKQAADAMREARDLAERAAETRSMFLANMSHEIRTPMNAVLGMVEIVLDSELSAEQRHSLELVRSSAESLLGVLNDVLDYSKIEAGHLDVEAIPFDLPKLVHTTASLLSVRAREKDLELIPDVASDVPVLVSGDPSRLRQVLTNLIGNALKFTVTGEVVVGVRAAPLEDGRPGVRFSVRDTGIGIAADRVGHIFEEFTQADGSTSRRFGGTGLGLTIAQRLVGLMGGRISVTTEIAKGSEFVFTLPYVMDPSQSAARPAKPVSLTGRRIIVVDDNSTNRRIYREILTAEGAAVDEAQDFASGQAALRGAVAAGTPPALAMIDVRMPGPDGFELAAAIRRNHALAGTAVLMLTSAGQRGDAARCRELGVSGYLTKPFSRSDLLETVAGILGGTVTKGAVGQVITRYTLSEARQPLRILLAEDNPVNQEVAATMLRRRGHRVDTAGNGLEAVAAVQLESYDLVLMDIQMPQMDGFEATAAIRALGERGKLPIVALTAHALSGERERCLSHGMDGYLPKPFKAHELFATVEGWGTDPHASLQTEPRAPILPTAIPPSVDLENLRSQLHDAGSEDALDGIVDTYLASVPERVATLCRVLVSGTSAEVATAAHALKSSAGAIGARPLATLLAEIEADGRAETLADRSTLAARAEAASDRVLTDLRAYRHQAA
ncbi:MAG: response regulator [Gemmatimonadota bacterium]